MSTHLLFDFTVAKEDNRIVVKRTFAAPPDLVWDAWTNADLLDQWWAPKPYLAQTISMNFSPGGMWHYAMVSPEGKKHYCKVYYQTVEPQKMFSYRDAFCDEHGVDMPDMPRMHWVNTFISDSKDSTTVHLVLTFESEEALETILRMGMQEGFTMALSNLDELLTTLKEK